MEMIYYNRILLMDIVTWFSYNFMNCDMFPCLLPPIFKKEKNTLKCENHSKLIGYMEIDSAMDLV